jgi:hypothetical protein
MVGSIDASNSQVTTTSELFKDKNISEGGTLIISKLDSNLTSMKANFTNSYEALKDAGNNLIDIPVSLYGISNDTWLSTTKTIAVDIISLPLNLLRGILCGVVGGIKAVETVKLVCQEVLSHVVSEVMPDIKASNQADCISTMENNFDYPSVISSALINGYNTTHSFSSALKNATTLCTAYQTMDATIMMPVILDLARDLYVSLNSFNNTYDRIGGHIPICAAPQVESEGHHEK